MIKKVETRPTTGQFVAMFLYMDVIMSETFEWIDGELLVSTHNGYMRGDTDKFLSSPDMSDVQYYINEDNPTSEETNPHH